MVDQFQEVDGLFGLPKAIKTIYPQPRVQLCMVHLVRNSLRYVSYKHMKAVATDLKVIYAASTEAEAEFNLELKALEMGCALPEQKPRRGRPDFPRVIPLMRPSTRSSIWRCVILPRSGPCRSVTGSQHPIALLESLRNGFPDEYRVV